MSFDLILFGGTGDLNWRKPMPAPFRALRRCKATAARGMPFEEWVCIGRQARLEREAARLPAAR
jgi:glucose-6-phosphate 1-dehydrogenase